MKHILCDIWFDFFVIYEDNIGSEYEQLLTPSQQSVAKNPTSRLTHKQGVHKNILGGSSTISAYNKLN